MKTHPPDDVEELRLALDEMGMSQVELARRVKSRADTVSRWMNRRAKVPGAVMAYIRLLKRVRRAAL